MKREVDIKIAGIVVALAAIVAVSVSMVVGYTFFWSSYDSRTQTEKDVSRFKLAVRENQKNPAPHIDLGWSYYEQGKWGKAIEEYTVAVNLDSDNVYAWYNLGLSYFKLNNYTKAEECFLKTISLDNKHDMAYFNLGLIYNKSAKYDKAVTYLKEASQLSPGSANFSYELGRAYEAKGQKQLALAAYTKSLKYVPDYKEASAGIRRLGGK